MADAGTIVKKVRTDFVTTGLDDMRADAAKARKEMERLAKARAGFNKGMAQLGGLARKALWGGAGLVGGLIAIGKAAEDSELKLTGLLQKNSQLFDGSFKSFTAARGAAKQLREEFRSMAITSPVTASAIADSFGAMTTELSRAGIDLKGQASLAKSVAVADLGNVSKGTAGRDVAQLLRGRAGQDISTAALVGQTGKEIAKLAKSGKVKEAAAEIAKVLKPSPELEKAYAESFTGATASLTDALTQAGEIAGQPLMQMLSEEAQKLLSWMKANKGEVQGIAKAIGKGIVTGLKTVGKILKGIVDHWDKIAVVLKMAAGVWLGRMVGHMLTLLRHARGLRATLGGAFAVATLIPDAIREGKKTYKMIKEGISGKSPEDAGKSIGAGMAALIVPVAQQKEEERAATLSGDFGGGDLGKTGGGGGRVRKLMVDNMELSERGTTRLMSPVVREMAREIRRNSPFSTQVGLGGLRVANGVR